MGIKNFSKTFKAVRTVKYKDLKGQTIAIDAMTELYRAALGAKTVATLTDAYGNPTLHISVILSIVTELHRSGVKQIWVFDHNQDPNADFHNPMKLGELAKRKKRKEIAIEQIKSLADLKDDSPMFSDDEEESAIPVDTESTPDSKPEDVIGPPPEMPEVVLTKDEEALIADMTYRQKAQFMLKKTTAVKKEYLQTLADYNFKKNKGAKIASLEKQTFSASKEMINDVKFILTCLNIKFIEAPKGFEGEAIASYLTQIGQADAVFSGDTDPIAYGAKILLRRNPKDKLIYEYTQTDILRQIAAANDNYPKPKLGDLHRVAMALGTDACEKTPGVGPATVLKKLHLIELNPAQIAAMKEFTKVPELSDIVTYNADREAFIDAPIDILVEWLVSEKSFTKSRVQTQINKALELDNPVKTTKPAKTTKAAKAVKSKSPKSPKSPPKSPPKTKKPILRKVIKK